MGQKYDFTATAVTIRRMQTQAEGEKPGLNRMVFSFNDELGNQVTCRAPIEVTAKELDRYVDERVVTRLSELSSPAETMIKEVRAAAEEAASGITALKDGFPIISKMVDEAIEKRLEEFKGQQKASRAKMTAAVQTFATASKLVAIKVAAKIEAPLPTPAQ